MRLAILHDLMVVGSVVYATQGVEDELRREWCKLIARGQPRDAGRSVRFNVIDT